MVMVIGGDGGIAVVQGVGAPEGGIGGIADAVGGVGGRGAEGRRRRR